MTYYPKVYHGSEPYIFVSYAHHDTDRVLPILHGLTELGFRLWYDAGIEAATEWPEYIAERLANSQSVLAFVTKASLASHNCRREINFSIELEKDLLTVYLEEVELSFGMRMQLGSLQAIHYCRHQNDRTFLDALSAAQVLLPCRADVKKPDEKSELDAVCQEFDQMLNEWVVLMGCQLAIGEPVDMQNTRRLLEMAKKLGHGADAICSLGDMASNAKDHLSALECYCTAAEMGHVPAVKKTGVCYYRGWGVDMDHRKAADYFRYAAERNDREAQYFLGILYESGQGVPQNLKEAILWFLKAEKPEDVRRCQDKLHI